MSGDMFLGALVDAGVPARVLEETVAALGVGARLEISRVEFQRPRWMCGWRGRRICRGRKFGSGRVSMSISILMSTMNIPTGISMNMRRMGIPIPFLVRVRGQSLP